MRPQIVTIFGPRNPLTGLHAVYEINHSTMPDYSEGGIAAKGLERQYAGGLQEPVCPGGAECHRRGDHYTTATEILNTGRVMMEVVNGVVRDVGRLRRRRALRLRGGVGHSGFSMTGIPRPQSGNSRIGYGATGS